MIRDQALAVSGLLVDRVGGESAHPYQPARYYQYLNFPKREYKSDTDENQYRRGVYVHWQRQYLHPMLKAFDAGDIATARQWHGKLFPLCRDLLGLATNPIPIKGALKMLARDTGEVRLPMTALNSAEEQRLAATLRAYGLL